MGISQFICSYPTVPILLGSLFFAWRSIKTQHHLARVKNAIEFQASFHNKENEIYLINSLKILKCKTAIELKELALQPIDNQDCRSLRNLLNTWERAAIAIESKVYSEAILFQAYRTIVIKIWISARPFVIQCQVRNQKAYENFDRLAVRWQVKEKI
jgi:hypothetical protein